MVDVFFAADNSIVSVSQATAREWLKQGKGIKGKGKGKAAAKQPEKEKEKEKPAKTIQKGKEKEGKAGKAVTNPNPGRASRNK